jgi:hypothetical protein
VLFKHKHQDTTDDPAIGNPAPPPGVAIDGVVLHYEPSQTRRTRARLLVGVKFEDGQTAEFTQEIVDFYQPPAHSTQAQELESLSGGSSASDADQVLSQVPAFARSLVRGAVEQNEVPVIPLSIYEGAILPVRYDPSNRTKLAIDEAALHERAFEAHIKSEQAQRANAWDKLNQGHTGAS